MPTVVPAVAVKLWWPIRFRHAVLQVVISVPVVHHNCARLQALLIYGALVPQPNVLPLPQAAPTPLQLLMPMAVPAVAAKL